VVSSDSAWHARFSKKILHWHLFGISVLCGVAWLLFRTGEEGTDSLDWMAFIFIEYDKQAILE